MNNVFIEPCCAEYQLPLLLENKSFAPFQTKGDVTFEHFIKSVSYLAGNNIDITLVVSSIDIDMLRVLAWLFRRGWLNNLQILTKDNQSDLINKELSDYTSNVKCYYHSSVSDHLLLISGEVAKVAIQGYLSSSVSPAHRFYNAVRESNKKTAPVFSSLLDGITPLLRSESKKKSRNKKNTEKVS